MAPEEIISDEEIERVHAHANFGSTSKRRVVDEGVLKYAFGYQGGSTQVSILREHGLVRQRNRSSLAASLTPKGKKYLRAMKANMSIDALLDTMSR
ncbi:hypothetical protein PsAD5_00137 [Pseudovibrio sp. Ad5]|uniref:hypothetical protein n=1 Tax=Pseudovibrio sp. Ad5 TaxID=989436 RepID=UPI0007AEBFE4|nr:hypothetical protein [Pseudovibrio sp. Ad5]KZL02188.1 hypothetical protein PsAD5_00137 [Pseudovibrio sp. Ad5]